MKKVIMFAAAIMFSVAAFAQVTVTQGKTVTNYEKGATITVDSKEVTEVKYGNVSISIPKGKKVVISQNKAGNIIISGYDLAGVKIMGREVQADEAAVYVVDPTTKTITKTPIIQTSVNNNKNTVIKNTQQNRNNQQNQNIQNNQENAVEDNFQDISDYVNEVSSQQAVEDIPFKSTI